MNQRQQSCNGSVSLYHAKPSSFKLSADAHTLQLIGIDHKQTRIHFAWMIGLALEELFDREGNDKGKK